MIRRLWNEVRSEVRPFEGRWATAWRVAALCALAAMVFMTYGIPLVAIACYLILFVMKPDPAESMLMAIGISLLLCLVVPLLFFLTRLSIESPMWRMVILAGSSFLFLYLGAASQLGPAGSIIALVIGFVMTLIGDVPFGEVATRALLYAWLMAAVPMGLIIVFNAAFGRSSVRLLREGIAHRLRLAALALEPDGAAAGREILDAIREGNESLEGLGRFVRLFHLVPRDESRALIAGIDDSYAVMLATMAGRESARETGWGQDAALRHTQKEQAMALAALIERGGLRAAAGDARPDMPTADMLSVRLAHFGVPPSQKDKALAEEGFFHRDALSNPVYQRFALKTTAAALICYIVYTAIQWQDIHTAMITCYVAALGTTGETLHKLTLRIVGCLIGAAMGVLSILFLVPLMTSIGELMVLVFAGILVAAWVSSGSERIAYAGVQIGLAFLLTVLQGFGPDIEMSVAMDRIVGILLGNAVIYLVFTRVWPVSAAEVVENRLARVSETIDKARDALSGARAGSVLATLQSCREELRFLHFEPRRLRTSDTHLARLRARINQLEALALRLAVPGAPMAASGNGAS